MLFLTAAEKTGVIICVFCALSFCSVCVCVPRGGTSRAATEQNRGKGQAGVGSQFSLGHRWRGELRGVQDRLGGHVEEEGGSGRRVRLRGGLRNVCAYISCMCV